MFVSSASRCSWSASESTALLFDLFSLSPAVLPTRALHEFEVDVPPGPRLRVSFASSTDFYGRVVIYTFAAFGIEAEVGAGV